MASGYSEGLSEMRSVEELLVRYRDSAVAHDDATQAGNHKKTNAAYDRMIAAFREIEGRHLENEFLRFLRDEHPSVRLWAATQALAFEPRQAEAVLEEIASGPRSTVRLDAEYVLRQWRAGTFRIPK